MNPLAVQPGVKATTMTRLARRDVRTDYPSFGSAVVLMQHFKQQVGESDSGPGYFCPFSRLGQGFARYAVVA
jgi:hypothetical protein